MDVPAPPAGPADPGAADPADPADPAGPADAAPAAPTPTLPQATVTLRGDVIGVPIACPAEILGGCAGTLTITVDEDVAERRRVSGARRRRTTKLGQQRFRIAAGEQKTVQVRLSRRASRKLKKTKKPKKGRGRRINIEVTVNGPTGPVTTTRSLTLLERRNSRSRPPRKRR